MTNPEMTWRNLKSLLRERSQSEKALYCMIPAPGHSGKGKALERVKEPVVPGVGVLGGAVGA